MLTAIVLTCLAAALYFTADLGVSAYDALALIAAYKYRLLPFKYCRIITDSICVLVGLVFDVTLGVGTVITPDPVVSDQPCRTAPRGKLTSRSRTLIHHLQTAPLMVMAMVVTGLQPGP